MAMAFVEVGIGQRNATLSQIAVNPETIRSIADEGRMLPAGIACRCALRQAA